MVVGCYFLSVCKFLDGDGNSALLVIKAFRTKRFLATVSALVLLTGMLLGSRVAVADSMWSQSYQRASASDACVAQSGETPWQASWGTDSSWKAGWEQWANAGKGGWVCSRSITWAKTPVAGGSSVVTYAVGDIGPGEGLVFLISGGLTYEMAPKAWGANELTGVPWCSDSTNSVTTNTAVGTGSANTTAMLTNASPFAACTSSAPNAARAYAGGGLTDWFLPSKDELNAMCYYSRNLSASPDPTVGCDTPSYTSQNPTFAAGAYGFAGIYYWSSSQESSASRAWVQDLDYGNPFGIVKTFAAKVRPVRAF
jgi:Protein of unknown function (DUF1566)